MPLTTGFNHVATLTTDMDQTIRFYEEAFDATVTFEITKTEHHPWMKVLDLGGGAALNVFEAPDSTIMRCANATRATSTVAVDATAAASETASASVAASVSAVATATSRSQPGAAARAASAFACAARASPASAWCWRSTRSAAGTTPRASFW